MSSSCFHDRSSTRMLTFLLLTCSQVISAMNAQVYLG